MASSSYAENGAGYFLTRDDMAWFYRQYLPDLGDATETECVCPLPISRQVHESCVELRRSSSAVSRLCLTRCVEALRRIAPNIEGGWRESRP